MNAPRYVKCPCDHCGIHIEFNANLLTDEHNILSCPHCGLETKLSAPATRSPYLEFVRRLCRRLLRCVVEIRSVSPGISGTGSAGPSRRLPMTIKSTVYPATSPEAPASEIQKDKLRFFGCTWNGDITVGEANDALEKCAEQFPQAEAFYRLYEWNKRVPDSKRLKIKPAGPSPSGKDASVRQTGVGMSQGRATVHGNGIPTEQFRQKRAGMTQGREQVPKPGFKVRMKGLVLDMAKIARIRKDTNEVAAILSPLMEDEPQNTIVLPKTGGLPLPEMLIIPANGGTAAQSLRFSGLDSAFQPILERLLTRDSWPPADFNALAREFHFMPLNIRDTLNEWSDEVLGDFILDGEDPVVIRRELIVKLTT